MIIKVFLILMFPLILYAPTTEQKYIDPLLYKIVYGECSICPNQEKYMIASVVLNRVKSDKWPRTVKEVIMQKNQFQGKKDTFTFNEVLVVSRAVSRPLPGIFYFCTHGVNKQKNVKYKMKYHVFY